MIQGTSAREIDKSQKIQLNKYCDMTPERRKSIVKTAQ
jgi:hypothetical protein